MTLRAPLRVAVARFISALLLRVIHCVGKRIGAIRSLTADGANHAEFQLASATTCWRRRSPSAETFSHDQDPKPNFLERGAEGLQGFL